MPAYGPRVLSSVLVNLDDVLVARGGPPLAKLLAQVSIDPAVVNHPAADIPLASFAELLELSARVTGEDCFGMVYAEEFPVGGTRVFGYLMRNAPNLRTFLQNLVRFMPIQVDSIDIEFHDGAAPRVVWSLPAAFLAPRKQIVEFLLVLFVRRVRGLFDPAFRPVAVEVEYRAPASRADYERLFGRNITFEAGGNAMTLHPEALGLVNRSADRLLYETMLAVAEERLRAVERARGGLKRPLAGDLMQQMTDAIVAALGSEEIDLDKAAAALGMSPRELQAELRRRDTNFAQELAGVRRRLAERYLRDTLLPMSEIALHLGFSEQSAFTRAAKGWFGVSPSVWRQQQREGDS